MGQDNQCHGLKTGHAHRQRGLALATGLYATHTFVPPTPGPIAAAGNLGLEGSLGLVIAVGLLVSAVAALAGMLWANRFLRQDDRELLDEAPSELLAEDVDFDTLRARYGVLPSAWQAFAPIFVPIALICIAFLAFIAWIGGQMTWRVRFQNVPSLDISISWIYLAIPVGATLAVIAVLARWLGGEQDDVPVRNDAQG